MTIIPTYTGFDEGTGRVLFGLSDSDFNKVTQGYGCPTCLEDFGGVYHAKCYVCGHQRDVSADVVETPRYWLPDPSDPDYHA